MKAFSGPLGRLFLVLASLFVLLADQVISWLVGLMLSIR